MSAPAFCFTSACGFFLVGLLAGAWKYACILVSPVARAPAYVDVAHRAGLMYAFACGLLGALCERSAYSDRTNLVACVILVVFFALPVVGYVAHGALRDTDNQFARPHRLGTRTVPPAALLAFMIALIVAELGAFGVVAAGYVATL